MRNYYLFRYSIDVYKPFVEEFKCMTYDEMLNYYNDLSSRFASLAYRDWEDRKSTRLKSSHSGESRMPSSA